VTATAIFHVPDPEGRLAGVRLHPDAPIPASLLDFRHEDGGWTLDLERPPVSRLEYLLEFRFPDGHDETGTDPGNPRLAAGAFGSKSVVEFPDYQPPAWLSAPASAGFNRQYRYGEIDVRVWCPDGMADEEPLPLLVAHDGPEYDSLASLTRYLSAGITGGWLPRLRAALLSPGPRNRWYSADPGYARALRFTVLPALISQLATTKRIGIGTSLGALAMLHAYCRYPGAFNALFLQSGSFFSPRFDEQERRFPYYRRVVRFVAGLQGDGRDGLPDQPIPVTLTCGAIEENIENNRLMTATLLSHGYPATLYEVSDTHNYTAWRDALDPHLTSLIGQVSQ
jgi:enterochelin esterase-like enzyme